MMSDNGERGRKPWFLLLGIPFIVFKVIVLLKKNELVIQYGIKRYRLVSSAATGLLAAFVVLAVILLLLGIRNKSRRGKPSSEAAGSGAILSVSGNLDAAKLYNILTTHAAQTRAVAVNEWLLKCAMQLKIMDIYQDKLARLLADNGADNLSDTKDVLDRVEQYICKNIRKVINYMGIADDTRDEDIRIITEKLTTCYTDCQHQLDQVKEFLFILAEFLNKQGENDTTPEILDIYRTTILKSLKEEK